MTRECTLSMWISRSPLLWHFGSLQWAIVDDDFGSDLGSRAATTMSIMAEWPMCNHDGAFHGGYAGK